MGFAEAARLTGHREMNSIARLDPKLGSSPGVPAISTGEAGANVPFNRADGAFGWASPFRLLAESIAASATAPAVTILCAAAILATCAATVLLGLPQMAVGGHDIFTFMDGGWRVSWRQVPSIDFYSALGPVYYLFWATGFKMAHFRVEGIVYATALAGVGLGLWSFAVARRRFGAVCAAVCTAFLVCLWVSPFVIGDPSYLTTYGEQYNRLGYVLLLILFVELFGARDSDGQPRWEWGGLSSGVALGLLLFLKANFFTVALVPLACAYVLRVKGLRHGVFLLCGFLAVLVPMSWYLHWHLGSYLTDLRIAAGARASQKGVLARALVRVPVLNFATILTLGALALLAQGLPRDQNQRAFPLAEWPLVLSFLVLGCDFVLALSNSQGSGLLLTVMAILLLADQLVRGMNVAERHAQWHLVACLFVLALTAALPHFIDLANAWQTELAAKLGGSPGYRIEAPQLAAMKFKDHSNVIWGPSWDNGHLMTDRINAGLALLREHTNPSERIACVCFTNPFSYALMREPPHGGSPFFDYGFNFSEAFAPAAERILGNADVVIYPKGDAGEGGALTIATLMRICKPILARNYTYVAESDEWVLLRRRGD